MSVPSSAELLDQIPNADPVLLHEVRMYVVRKLADRLRPELEKLIKENDDAPGEWWWLWVRDIGPKGRGKAVERKGGRWRLWGVEGGG